MTEDAREQEQLRGRDIPIEQATAESVSKELFDREFGWLKRELEGVNKLMAAVVVVFVLGFTTLLLMVAEMLIESWRFKSSVDQALIQSLEKQDSILEGGLRNINEQNKILQKFSEVLEK